MIDQAPTVDIDGLEFTVGRYDISDQQVFGPRFGSGSLDESDLTLRRALTFKGVDASSFTPADPSRLIPRVTIGLRSELTNTLLPTPTFGAHGTDWSMLVGSTTYSTASADAWYSDDPFYEPSTFWKVTDQIEWNGKVYIGLLYNNSSLAVINMTDGTSITLPAGFTTSARDITFAVREGTLFVCSYASGIYYLSGTSLVKIPSSTGNYRQIFNLNGRMYGVGGSGKVYDMNATTSSLTTTLVTNLKDFDPTWGRMWPMAVLNGRAYFVQDGNIICFDGVRAYSLIKSNAKIIREWQGALYFDNDGKLMRTNGSTVETLYDFAKLSIANDSEAASNARLMDLRPYRDKLHLAIDHRYSDSTYAYTEFHERHLLLPEDVATGLHTFTDNGVPFQYGKRHSIGLYVYDGKEITMTSTVSALGQEPDNAHENNIVRAVQFCVVDDVLRIVALRYSYTAAAFITMQYSWARAGDDTWLRPLRVSFYPVTFGFSSLNKKIVGFSASFNGMYHPTASHSRGSYEHFPLEDHEFRIYYRPVGSTGNDSWILCKTFTAPDGVLALDGEPDVDIPASHAFEFMITTVFSDIGEVVAPRGLASFTVEYILQTYYKAQWNLVLMPTNDIETAPSAAALAKIKTLRDQQAVFTFTDVDGTTHSAIIDSFSANVQPAYTEATYAPEITVVIREV